MKDVLWSSDFEEVVAPMKQTEAIDEALRCYYCYDAPCIKACPTAIDIPVFIKQIATGHVSGAARTILDANPLGATCARICPTEALCEGDCVRGKDSRPVAIGRLQRVATDYAMSHGVPDLAAMDSPKNQRVAVVGAGPAGLGAAYMLTRLGYQVEVFDRHSAGGGLDTYGIVSFREPVAVSLWEVNWLTDMGVKFHYNTTVGHDILWKNMQNDFDALVVAVGLGKVPYLGIDGEDLPGVFDALDLIEASKIMPRDDLRMGGTVAVIGAGNTAVDAATLAKRLGAERVVIIYRRGEEAMPAYRYEFEFAKSEGIEYRWWTRPLAIKGTDRVEALELVKTRPDSTDTRDRQASIQDVPDSQYTISVSAVIRAVGQGKQDLMWNQLGIDHQGGRVAIHPETFETTVPGVYVIGDALARNGEATVVQAVADGKQCALAVHTRLQTKREETQDGGFIG